MAFCSFSKDCNDNAYTLIDNKFITKYLPEADGFAVKVYLYGLFLCNAHDSDISLSAMAKELGADVTAVENAFALWEDYDLVQILSKEPFLVAYLPVRTAIGKPKKIRYEQYADFNKELQLKMQQVGKFISPGDYIKYMRFLEENSLQPQTFLLIAEYCINKQGSAVSPAYIFNKAKKFIRNGWTSYEQVEKELSSYHEHEAEVSALFTTLNLFKTPDETDYALYKKWTADWGFEKDAILFTAKHLKRGTLNALDLTLNELFEKEKRSLKDVERYLTERDTLVSLTFRIARKLGVKISNPAGYVDEYVEKWYNYGFEESSLLDVALYCLRTERGDFSSMDEQVRTMFTSGVVGKESVKVYLKAKNDELKLFVAIQGICGAIRKSAANLALIQTWRSWKFSDEMVLEAAKRSAASANPIPYMNKILSEWMRAEVFKIADIPAAEATERQTKAKFVDQTIEAVNAKADRDKYYATLRDKALSVAEKYQAKAQTSSRFKEITLALSKMEISLAKAEVFSPEKMPALLEEKARLVSERTDILKGLNITEEQLSPQFKCKKCSDTGFLPNGVSCDCYQKQA